MSSTVLYHFPWVWPTALGWILSVIRVGDEILSSVREVELWNRLQKHLGENYCRVWADQMVLKELGQRTVMESLESGVPTKKIWEACWKELELPLREK